jgi:hypothetical protein
LLLKLFFVSFCKVLIQLLCLWELLPWKMYLKVVIYSLDFRPVSKPNPHICLFIELIGEEIYDEFDQEGAHGDRTPYESPTQERNDGQLEGPYSLSSHQRAQSDASNSNGWNGSPANVFPTSLKSLGFFRTKSAPPVPRETETEKYFGDDKVDWEMMDDEKDNLHFSDPGQLPPGKFTTAIQVPKPIKGTGRYPPSVILEQHSTISSHDSATPAVTSVDSKGLTVPPPTYQKPSSVVTAPVPIRLTPSALLQNPRLTQTAPTTPVMSTTSLRVFLILVISMYHRRALKVFFNHRDPAPNIVPLALLPISYPIGNYRLSHYLAQLTEFLSRISLDL